MELFFLMKQKKGMKRTGAEDEIGTDIFRYPPVPNRLKIIRI